MATYKVIQDIEAEDKFVGPLTLKQFIFAGSAIFFAYLNYFFGVAMGAWFMMILFTPPMLLGGFLAFPWSKEQSTEVWVLAKLRFKIKPQVRIWDQSGFEQLVTITVPKKIEKQLTNGLDQFEVESRLKALAETIDTRGWATKNATQNTAYAMTIPGAAERLINPASLPQQVPDVDLNSYTDVLDEHDTVSENFDQMILASKEMHRQQSLERMEQARQPVAKTVEPNIQFAPPASSYAQPNPIDEATLAEQLKSSRKSHNANTHMRRLSTTPQAAHPVSTTSATPMQPAALPAPDLAAPDPFVTDEMSDDKKPQAEMTKTPNADIIDLARNNDLNVETIARQAKKNNLDDGEVVISLH